MRFWTDALFVAPFPGVALYRRGLQSQLAKRDQWQQTLKSDDWSGGYRLDFPAICFLSRSQQRHMNNTETSRLPYRKPSGSLASVEDPGPLRLSSIATGTLKTMSRQLELLSC